MTNAVTAIRQISHQYQTSSAKTLSSQRDSRTFYTSLVHFDPIGHEARAPHFYKLLGTVYTMSRRSQNKKNDQTVRTITKALTKTTNCICTAKKVEEHDKKISGASRDMCPPPLLTSFRRHLLHDDWVNSISTTVCRARPGNKQWRPHGRKDSDVNIIINCSLYTSRVSVAAGWLLLLLVAVRD